MIDVSCDLCKKPGLGEEAQGGAVFTHSDRNIRLVVYCEPKDNAHRDKVHLCRDCIVSVAADADRFYYRGVPE